MRSADPSSESGTTLTEVLVVLAITTVLAAPLLAVVRTTLLVQDGRAAEDEATIELEAALGAMTEDLRTGAPVETRPRGTAAGDTVGVRVIDSTGAASVVYWSVGSRGLRRIEADPDTGRVSSRSTVNRDITGTDSGDPVFRYYDATGRELQQLAIGLERLAECTALVEVELSVPIGDDPDDRLISGTARHAVRSRSAGGNGC